MSVFQKAFSDFRLRLEDREMFCFNIVLYYHYEMCTNIRE